MKFKVGDKVRIVKNIWNSDNCSEVGIGETCMIIFCDTTENYPYTLNKYTHLLWCDDELELVEDEKMFTKKDLKDGMVVEHRDGERHLVLGKRLIGWRTWRDIQYINDDLNDTSEHLAIDKVYQANGHTLQDLLDDNKLTLIWERERIKEMTVEEIEKELGYKIKVVTKD